MNILQISGGHIRIPPKNGGAQELIIYNISKQFVEFGNNVTIIDRKYSNEDKFIDDIDGIQIIRLNPKRFNLIFLDKIKLIGKLSGYVQVSHLIRSLINGLCYSIEVNSYIKKNKNYFDVIHLHFVAVGLLLVLLNPSIRKRTIYTAHFSIHGYNQKALKFFDKILINLESYLINNVAKITIVNPTYRTLFIERLRLDPKTIAAIPNGVDINEFNFPIIETKDNLRNMNNDSEIVILYVGRITSIKGIDYLIDAADILINNKNYKNISFQIVGPNSLSTEYEKKIISKVENLKLSKYIKFLCYVSRSELIKLYYNCDIFVLPSIAESFGLVITEAMASGKPVVATCTSGAAMQIINGWNGYLVETANIDSLADRIKDLIDNPEDRNRMGKNGRLIVMKEFDWPIVAKKYFKLYLLE